MSAANPFTPAEREVLAPRLPLLPVPWAEKNVVVQDGEAKGHFSRHTMPVLASPINSIADPRYERVVAMAATQSGKSLGLNQIPFSYWLEHCRAHTGFGIANRKVARRVYSTKLKPMFEAVPSLAKLIPSGGAGSRGGFPTELMLKNGALFLFMGAGSAADMAQATIQNLVLDETDKADEESASGREADPIQQMIRRTDAYQLSRRIVCTCTPTVPHGYIARAYEEGTKGVAYVRCPGCGEWFWFEWSWDNQRVGWDDDSSDVAAMETAFYPCPNCDHRLREEERLFALRRPLWVHEGEKIEPCSVDEAEGADAFTESAVCGDQAFIVRGERKRTRTVSWWWSRLYSPFTTLGHIAEKVRAARDEEEKRHGICIYDMGLPYAGKVLDSSELDKDAVLSRARYAGYKMGREGRMPFAVEKRLVVTAGVDIGKHLVHASVDAWRVDDKGYLLESWRVWLACPYRVPSPDHPDAIYQSLVYLRRVMLRGWKDVNGSEFRPRCVGIDTGYQHGKKRTRGQMITPSDRQVYRFCRDHGQAVWRAVDGRDTLGGEGVVIRSLLEQHRVILWAVDTDVCKLEVQDQVRVPAGEPGYWHLPENTPPEYARGLCAEKRVVEFDQKNLAKAEWVVVDPYNHPLDAAVYSWAMARTIGVKPPRQAVPADVNAIADEA